MPRNLQSFEAVIVIPHLHNHLDDGDNYLHNTAHELKLTWDETKRQTTLAERGLDFVDANKIFANATFEFEDTREIYGEKRVICLGYLHGRLMVVGYVQHGEGRRIFSMRKANEREQSKFG